MPCVSTCDTACVAVCPVDCIHGPKDPEGLGMEVANMSKEELEEIALKDMHSNWISNAYESITQEEEYKKKGEQAIKNFIQRELQLKKEKRETIETENKFEIEIEGKRFIGYIDRTDKVGDNIEIMDYKTSNSMETEKKLVDNLQLGVYALAVKEKYKKFPHKVALWYLIHDKILALEFDKHNLEGTKQKILETTNKIEEGDFTAKPSNFACRFCDFNKICDKSLF